MNPFTAVTALLQVYYIKSYQKDDKSQITPKSGVDLLT